MLEGEFFCICDQEWCWCTNLVDELDKPCDECAKGTHVPSPSVRVFNRQTCLACAAGIPGRHPDATGTHLNG